MATTLLGKSAASAGASASRRLRDLRLGRQRRHHLTSVPGHSLLNSDVRFDPNKRPHALTPDPAAKIDMWVPDFVSGTFLQKIKQNQSWFCELVPRGGMLLSG
jgi:hypothetical protein